MNPLSVRAFRALIALAVICLLAGKASAQSATPRIVSAANAFLASLDETQRKSVLFAFDDEEQRARWSNLPIRAVRRAGVNLGELTPSQRSAALALLASVLSRERL